MKINKTILIFTFLTLNFIILIPLNIYQANLIDLNQNNTAKVDDLRYKEVPSYSSENIISYKIHINNNWTETNSSYDWCKGSGTILDPFIIEYIRIINQFEGAFITIENSNDYFKIRYCNLTGIIGHMFHGIVLKNVSNGMIYNNSINLYYQAIILNNCSHLNIFSNYLKDNPYGFYSINSQYIGFISNIIIDCTYFGLYSRFGSFCNITGNIIENNDKYYIHPAWDRYIAFFGYDLTYNIIRNNSIVNLNQIHEGMFLRLSYNNSIINNRVNNGEYGINLDVTDSNQLIGNKINNCKWGIIVNGDKNNFTGNQMNNCGILLDYFGLYTQFIDITNVVNNKPLYYYKNVNFLNSENFSNAGQIILINCNHSIISKFCVSQSSVGIYLERCSNNTVSFISASSCQYGIFLWQCKDIEIKECISNKNEISGIVIRYGSKIMLVNNQMNYNINDGINIDLSDKIYLINNTLSNNIYNGITIRRCENASILHNSIISNGVRGVFLNSVENSSVCYNDVKGNNFDGVQLAFSKYILIKNNNIFNNLNGIQLSHGSIHNSIIQNILFNNEFCYIQDDNSEPNFYYGNICGNTRISTQNIITFLIPICIILLLAWIFREKRS
ncbi:MAG: NosD domain-containing protein [Candidatus Hodarchaeota archaeon]